MDSNKFIHLHTHDRKGSLLDSILTVEQLAQFAYENNYPSIADTNHGTMYSYVDFYKACLDTRKQTIKNNADQFGLSKEDIKDLINCLPKNQSIKDNLLINERLSSYYKKYPKLIEECIIREVKPIIGCEVYEVDNMELKNDTKLNKQPRYHLLLLCKNQKGLENLFKIVTESNTIGFYGKPRIDIDYIKRNELGEGIICLTACQAGRLSRSLTQKKEKDVVVNYINKLRSTFDYVSLEIQSHDSQSQVNANNLIIEFAEENRFPYVITCDAHMLKGSQTDTHAIFIQISEDREVGETYEGCYLQKYEEIHNYMDKYHGYEVIEKAIKETINISNMIDWVDVGLNNGNQMPIIKTPKEFRDNDEYFKHLVYKNFDNKFNYLSNEEKQKRRDRIEMEFPVLKALDFIDYFIMLYLLAKEADKRQIPRGYSRGSGANCECLFMLNVTQIDSIRWDLDFSRFANLGRKSVADFDWDISKRRRKEMVDISEDLFGKEKVAPICTFNTLSTKVAIRDIGKVLDEKKIYDLPYKIRDEVSKMIPTIKTINDLGEEEEKDVLLKEVFFKNPKLKEIDEQYPLWFKYVMELEGSPKSLGRHAAGTIIAPKPLVEYCPLCLDSEGNVMLQLEMHNAMDDLGLCKMDFLGLETLDIIDDTLKMKNLTWGDMDINHINLEDKDVFDSIYKNGNTIGIFQMESAEATKMCVEANTDNIEDVIAINAFNRPGTKDSFPTYIKNKKNPDKIEVIHEDLKQILGKTFTVLLYQEQALQMFRYANFPEDQVDNARRSIGKKIQKVMEELKKDFHVGLKNKGWNDKQIDEMWNLIKKQADYSFNRGHSVAYGLLSYLTAYLKYYYPLEFMTACLIAKSSNVSKLGIFINECNRLGIKVLPPNINESKENFTPRSKTNDILFGILPIKGIGKSVVEAIISNQPYSNYEDFINKTKYTGVITKDVIITLCKAGAFPTKSKLKFLQKYADSLFADKQYSTVVSLPTIKELKEQWGIEAQNKEERLRLYNIAKEKKFNKEKQEKLKKHRKEFADKYLQNEYMWEFETLSMFLTNNPFEEAYRYVKPFDEVENEGKSVVICTILDIKRKKDKKNNTFAYLDLYTPFGVIESICWASKYSQYQNLIIKGNSIAILGKKNEDKLMVEAIKSFEQWKKDVVKVS